MSNEAPSISSIVRPDLLEKVNSRLSRRASASSAAELARTISSQAREGGGVTVSDFLSRRSSLIPEKGRTTSSNSTPITMSSLDTSLDMSLDDSSMGDQRASLDALAKEQLAVAKAAEEQARELEEAQSAAAKAEEQALKQRQEMDTLREAAEKEAEKKALEEEKDRQERLAREAEEAEAALQAIKAEEEARLAREEEELKLALKLEEAKAELEAQKAQEEQDRALEELQAASLAAKQQLAADEELQLDLEPKNLPEEEEEEEKAEKGSANESSLGDNGTASAPSENPPSGERTTVEEKTVEGDKEEVAPTTETTEEETDPTPAPAPAPPPAEPTEEAKVEKESTDNEKPEVTKEVEKKQEEEKKEAAEEEKEDSSIHVADDEEEAKDEFRPMPRMSEKEESIHMVRMMLRLQDKEDRRSSALFHQLDTDNSDSASHEEMAKFLANNHSLWTMLSLNFGLSKEQSTRLASEVAMVLATGCEDRIQAMQQQLSKEQFKTFRKKYIVDKAGAQEFFFRAVFATFDKDKNNALCEQELDAFLDVFYLGSGVFEGPTALELPPKDHLRKLMLEKFDAHDDKLIQFEEIQQIFKMADGSVSKLALTEEMTTIIEEDSSHGNLQELATKVEADKNSTRQASERRQAPVIKVVDEEKRETDFCDWLERSFTPPEKQTKEKMGYCREGRPGGPCIIL